MALASSELSVLQSGSTSPLYYSVNAGPAHMVYLSKCASRTVASLLADAADAESHPCVRSYVQFQEGSAQYEWLIQDLASCALPGCLSAVRGGNVVVKLAFSITCTLAQTAPADASGAKESSLSWLCLRQLHACRYNRTAYPWLIGAHCPACLLIFAANRCQCKLTPPCCCPAATFHAPW